MATLYFNAAVNNNWATLGNWWQNSTHTTPATALPGVNDDVILNATVSSNSGSAPSVRNLTMNDPSNQGRYLGINITVNATGTNTATFNGSSYNAGTLTGRAIFNDNARNTGTVTGTGTFTRSSFVGAPSTWRGVSINSSTIFTANAPVFTLSGTDLWNVSSGALSFSSGTPSWILNGQSTFSASFNGSINGANASITFTGNSYTSVPLSTGVSNFNVFFTSATPVTFAISSGTVSSNTAAWTFTATPTWVFTGSTSNSGTLTGNATFSNNSHNRGTVTGNATFNDAALNYGTFSTGYGTVNGNATFTSATYNVSRSWSSTSFVGATNQRPMAPVGIVLGTVTFSSPTPVVFNCTSMAIRTNMSSWIFSGGKPTFNFLGGYGGFRGGAQVFGDVTLETGTYVYNDLSYSLPLTAANTLVVNGNVTINTYQGLWGEQQTYAANDSIPNVTINGNVTFNHAEARIVHAVTINGDAILPLGQYTVNPIYSTANTGDAYRKPVRITGDIRCTSPSGVAFNVYAWDDLYNPIFTSSPSPASSATANWINSRGFVKNWIFSGPVNMILYSGELWGGFTGISCIAAGGTIYGDVTVTQSSPSLQIIGSTLRSRAHYLYSAGQGSGHDSNVINAPWVAFFNGAGIDRPDVSATQPITINSNALYFNDTCYLNAYITVPANATIEFRDDSTERLPDSILPLGGGQTILYDGLTGPGPNNKYYSNGQPASSINVTFTTSVTTYDPANSNNPANLIAGRVIFNSRARNAGDISCWQAVFEAGASNNGIMRVGYYAEFRASSFNVHSDPAKNDIGTVTSVSGSSNGQSGSSFFTQSELTVNFRGSATLEGTLGSFPPSNWMYAVGSGVTLYLTFNDTSSASSVYIGNNANLPTVTLNDYAYFGSGVTLFGDEGANCVLNDYSYVSSAALNRLCTLNDSAYLASASCPYASVLNNSAYAYNANFGSSVAVNDIATLLGGTAIFGKTTFMLSAASAMIGGQYVCYPYGGIDYKYEKGINGSSILGVV